MEAIMTDLRRAMRSIQTLLHAVSGAGDRHGTRKGRTAPMEKRADIYGRRGRVDLYSGRDTMEFYALMARSAQPPFLP